MLFTQKSCSNDFLKKCDFFPAKNWPGEKRATFPIFGDFLARLSTLLFGKTDEMRGHQIENELISLSPSSFKSLQLYFTKFKALVLQLKQCGIEKKEEQLVLTILSNIGPKYSVFFLPSMPLN